MTKCSHTEVTNKSSWNGGFVRKASCVFNNKSLLHAKGDSVDNAINRFRYVAVLSVGSIVCNRAAISVVVSWSFGIGRGASAASL